MPYGYGTFTVSLDAAGAPGHQVTMKDPLSLPWGQIKKIKTIQDEGSVEEAVKELVVGWDLPHPDTDEVLPLPREQSDVLDLLPTGVMNAIARAIADRVQEAAPKNS